MADIARFVVATEAAAADIEERHVEIDGAVGVTADGETLLTTQFYVLGEPGNARDFLWRQLDEAGQAALTRPFVAGPDGDRAEYAVVVQA